MSDFETAFELAAPIPGWLTREQAADLHAAVRSVPPGGTVVEIGSHLGRSTVVLARALPPGATLVAVDPFTEGWRYGAAGTEQACRRNLESAGVADRVDLRVTTSSAALDSWDDRVDLVYVDGKHDVWSLRSDLRWADRMPDGSTVLVHDAFSSLGVTLGLLSVLPWSGRLRYVGRTGSLARLEVGRPGGADRLRPLAELPWWVRNLTVKVLLRLRMRAAAALLGHHDSADPY